MKFGYAILYVDNVADTVTFYERAFGLKRLFVHESQSYAEMDTGATKLAFASRALAAENGLDISKPQGTPIEIALVTEQVQSDFTKAVSEGAKEIKKPVKKPWGQVVGYVADLNGFLVEICSPMAG